MHDFFSNYWSGIDSSSLLGTFEPKLIRSTKWKMVELKNASPVLHWLGRRYPIRKAQVLHAWGVQSEHWEIEIGQGEYRLGVNHMNPFTLKCMDLPVTFHIGHIVKTAKHPYTNGLRELVRMVRYLEKMPDCPVMVAFYKVGKLPGVVMRDCPIQQPSLSRLRSIYGRILGNQPMGITDPQGNPYIKIDFNPKHPVRNMLTWEESLRITNDLAQNQERLTDNS